MLQRGASSAAAAAATAAGAGTGTGTGANFDAAAGGNPDQVNAIARSDCDNRPLAFETDTQIAASAAAAAQAASPVSAALTNKRFSVAAAVAAGHEIDEEDDWIADVDAHAMVSNVSSVFRKKRYYSDHAFVSAMTGILLVIVAKEVRFANKDTTEIRAAVNVLLSLCSLSTLYLLYALFQYHDADFRYEQLTRVFLTHTNYWPKYKMLTFLSEAIICSIHEPPFLKHDVDVSVSDLQGGVLTGAVFVRNPWSILCILRIYLFLRLVLMRYYSGGTTILGLWFGFRFNSGFTVRNMLFSHPMSSILPVFLVLILSSTYAMTLCEREVPGREFHMGTGTWLVFMTITGVGYGDITPLTSCGRGTSIIAALSALVVSAVLIAAVNQQLTLLPYESRMVEFLERSTMSAEVVRKAQICIRRAVAWHLAKKKGMTGLKMHLIHRSMIDGIYKWQAQRKKMQAYDRRYHSNQLFRNLLENIQDQIAALSTDADGSDGSEQHQILQKMQSVLNSMASGKSASSAAIGSRSSLDDVSRLLNPAGHVRVRKRDQRTGGKKIVGATTASFFNSPRPATKQVLKNTHALRLQLLAPFMEGTSGKGSGGGGADVDPKRESRRLNARRQAATREDSLAPSATMHAPPPRQTSRARRRSSLHRVQSLDNETIAAFRQAAAQAIQDDEQKDSPVSQDDSSLPENTMGVDGGRDTTRIMSLLETILLRLDKLEARLPAPAPGAAAPASLNDRNGSNNRISLVEDD